jgi:recombination protein RecA
VALGGGLPRGRIIEIFGAEGGGKTTLTLHCIAEMQRSGGICGLHRRRARAEPEPTPQALGVDIDNLFISQPGQRRAGS